jgi:hypothetical protein
VDVRAVAGADGAAGVAHGAVLCALAEALVGEDDAELARARNAALSALGPAGLVDAVAVASNFERMVRIADATGIALDGPLELATQDLRAELGLARFGSSANTPARGWLGRLAGRALAPAARAALWAAARLAHRRRSGE